MTPKDVIKRTHFNGQVLDSNGLGHFGDALSATGRSGDRRFGEKTFRRPPVRRRDISATARSAMRRFGDQSSTVFVSKQYGAQIQVSED